MEMTLLIMDRHGIVFLNFCGNPVSYLVSFKFYFGCCYHTGEVAIEIVNTMDDRRSKMVRNRVFDCHLSD